MKPKTTHLAKSSLFVGMDLHKKFLQIVAVNSSGKVLCNERIDNNPIWRPIFKNPAHGCCVRAICATGIRPVRCPSDPSHGGSGDPGHAQNMPQNQSNLVVMDNAPLG